MHPFFHSSPFSLFLVVSCFCAACLEEEDGGWGPFCPIADLRGFSFWCMLAWKCISSSKHCIWNLGSNHYYAQPNLYPIQRMAIKGFRDWGSRLSSGGSFWSPGWGRSRSSLEIDWIFFCHYKFPESAVYNFRKHNLDHRGVKYISCVLMTSHRPFPQPKRQRAHRELQPFKVHFTTSRPSSRVPSRISILDEGCQD